MNRMRLGATLRRVVGVAMLSLVLAQWVALVHAIEHAHGPSAAADQHDPDGAWGHEAGSSACLLIDHLLTGQAPGEPATGLPDASAAESTAVGPTKSVFHGRNPKPYQARGPPRA